MLLLLIFKRWEIQKHQWLISDIIFDLLSWHWMRNMEFWQDITANIHCTDNLLFQIQSLGQTVHTERSNRIVCSGRVWFSGHCGNDERLHTLPSQFSSIKSCQNGESWQKAGHLCRLMRIMALCRRSLSWPKWISKNDILNYHLMWSSLNLTWVLKV